MFSVGDGSSRMDTMRTQPSVNGEKTPVINVQQVSVDGEEHEVQMRYKKSTVTSKIDSKTNDDEKGGKTPKASIAHRFVTPFYSAFWR